MHVVVLVRSLVCVVGTSWGGGHRRGPGPVAITFLDGSIAIASRPFHVDGLIVLTTIIGMASLDAELYAPCCPMEHYRDWNHPTSKRLTYGCLYTLRFALFIAAFLPPIHVHWANVVFLL
jgi:hypothetical protein